MEHLGDFPASIVADRDELSRTFTNLFRNGIQAMDRGGTMTVSSRRTATGCELRITDTGHGIPSHLLERVFQPNFSTRSEGMGLGLAIAKKAIEDLNGSIDVEQTSEAGTTILIELPLPG